MSFRIVVLVSGSGTLLQSLIDHVDGSIEIAAVVADRECQGLDRARANGIAAHTHPLGASADRAAWDATLTSIVDRYDPDLVVSAGFMKLVGAHFLAKFGGRTINTHPALLPSFPGMHGPKDALDYGVKVSGATVFLVDAGVDTGRIIDQACVRVEDDDTVETLHERIKVAERRLLVETVEYMAANKEK